MLTKKHLLGLASALLISASDAPQASAATVLDQIFDARAERPTQAGGFNVGAGALAAQSFTANVAGRLASVGLQIERGFVSSNAPDPILSIVRLMNDLPTGQSLGQIVLPYANIPISPVRGGGTFFDVDVGSLGIDVQPLDELALVLSFDTTGISDTLRWFNIGGAFEPTTYVAGSFFFTPFSGGEFRESEGADAGFRTLIDGAPIPLPAAGWMLFATLGMLRLIARQRVTKMRDRERWHYCRRPRAEGGKMMRSILFRAACVAGVAAAAPGQAAAVTLDFDSFASAATQSFASPFVVGDYQFTGNFFLQDYFILGSADSDFAGSPSLLFRGNEVHTFQRVDGAAFDLVSLDFAENSPTSNVESVN